MTYVTNIKTIEIFFLPNHLTLWYTWRMRKQKEESLLGYKWSTMNHLHINYSNTIHLQIIQWISSKASWVLCVLYVGINLLKARHDVTKLNLIIFLLFFGVLILIWAFSSCLLHYKWLKCITSCIEDTSHEFFVNR